MTLKDRCAARIRFEHDVGRLDVAMRNAALFGGGQSARRFVRLLQAPARAAEDRRAALWLERFAFDQLHDIETLAILFAIMMTRAHWDDGLRGARARVRNAIGLRASSRLFGL